MPPPCRRTTPKRDHAPSRPVPVLAAARARAAGPAGRAARSRHPAGTAVGHGAAADPAAAAGALARTIQSGASRRGPASDALLPLPPRVRSRGVPRRPAGGAARAAGGVLGYVMLDLMLLVAG